MQAFDVWFGGLKFPSPIENINHEVTIQHVTDRL